MMSTLNRLHTWVLVRLGLWRRQWRRGRVEVPGVRFHLGQLSVRAWNYGLYVPAGLADGESAPLIVVLHGCKQRALGFAHAAGWTRLADKARMRLLCPDQRRLANVFRCWNWFHPWAQRGQGELEVVTAMLDDVAARVHVDPDAVAAVGLSAGGALAALLAFHRPDRFRAVVTVAAPPLLGTHGMQSPQSVLRRGLTFGPLLALGAVHRACAPLAIIHGLDDPVVHPRCAEKLLAQALESLRRAGIRAQAGDAVAASRGLAVTDFRTGGKLWLRRIEVKDLGHAWTGGPGGHPYCERRGAALTELCAQFLRDAAAIGG